jgi:hypothetical protein
MNRSHFVCWVFGLLTIFALASLGLSQEPLPAAQQAPSVAVPKNDAALQNPIEVQTRGPLHEAFAQPFDMPPEPGTLVPKTPPAPIPEEPQDQRPDNPNAQWIPGYWAWDDQTQDFTWVSGVYRVPPQGRTFIPGYWQNTPDGWRWVSGIWSDANQPELPYTPEPPAPLDNGPSMPAPNEDSMYVPGNWVYRDTSFVWQPGYYAAVQPGRLWIPARYLWTPRGYLFVDGYWDYPLEARGLVFAPVCFRRPLWTDPSWRFRPSFVVSPAAIFDSAFVRRGGSHFYFGNYYDPAYARAGFRPWYAGVGRHDPLFAYHGWQNHRHDPNWVAGVQRVYADRITNRAARPPLTLSQQAAFVSAKSAAPVVTPIGQFRSTHFNVVATTRTQLDAQRTFAERTRQLAQSRSRLDVASVAKAGSAPAFRASQGRSLNTRTLTETTRAGVSGAPTAPLQSHSTSQARELPRGPKSAPAAPSMTQSTATSRAPRTSATPPRVNPPPPAARVNAPPPNPRANTPPPAPRSNTRPAAPRINTPAPAPHVNAARPAPRVSTPRPAPTPRPSASRSAPAPRANATRPAPRVNTPRPAPVPRASTPRPAPAPRAMPPRPNASSRPANTRRR